MTHSLHETHDINKVSHNCAEIYQAMLFGYICVVVFTQK